jgi:hypothetical protein
MQGRVGGYEEVGLWDILYRTQRMTRDILNRTQSMTMSTDLEPAVCSFVLGEFSPKTSPKSPCISRHG